MQKSFLNLIFLKYFNGLLCKNWIWDINVARILIFQVQHTEGMDA